MLPSLLLGAALGLGQPPAPPPEPPEPLATDAKALDVTAFAPAPVPIPAAAAAATAPAARWPLMRSVQGSWLGALLDDNRLTIYGWTEASFVTGTDRGTNLPEPFVDRPNEFLLNQNFLHFERTIDPSKRAYQWGFVSEVILPGSDYRFTLPRGIANSQLTSNDGRPELYGIDPFQFYLQAFLPDLGPRGTKVVFGRFATHVGYELVQAVDTPFVSRAYLFQYNPFTHTGAWATTQLTDDWSVGNGLSTGTDTVFNDARRTTYLGQVKWAPPTGRTAVAFNVVLSNPTFSEITNYPFYNVYDLLVAHKLSDRLTYTLDATYSNIRGVPGTGSTDWYGAAQYLTYQFAPTLAGTVRAELFNDTTGFRTGSEGLYTEVTAGLAWKPLPELLVRPFARYDYNSESRPFEDKPYLFTAGLDLIVRW